MRRSAHSDRIRILYKRALVELDTSETTPMLITTALLLQPLLAPPTVEDAPLLPPPVPAALQRSKKPTGPPMELSWRFLEVHAQYRDVDGLDDPLPGFGLRGGWEFDEGIFVRGGIDLYSDDDELTRYDVGIGQSVKIRDDASAFASASWVWKDVDVDGGGSDTENGWRLEGGFRAIFDAHLTGELRLGYADIGTDGWVYGADLRYWFIQQVALGIGYEHEIDDDLYTLSLRYGF